MFVNFFLFTLSNPLTLEGFNVILLSTNSALSNTSEFKIQIHLHLHQQSKKGRPVNQKTAKRRVSN